AGVRLDAGGGAVHRRDVDLPRLCPSAQQLGLKARRSQRVLQVVGEILQELVLEPLGRLAFGDVVPEREIDTALGQLESGDVSLALSTASAARRANSVASARSVSS